VEEVILKFKNNCMEINELITYLDLFYFIRKGYMRIYKEEKEKHTEIMVHMLFVDMIGNIYQLKEFINMEMVLLL
jgi:hypothetical protein